MRDNALLQIIIPVISAGLVAAGLPAIPIKQSGQPTQQGVDLSATIYLTKLFDRPYGFLSDREYYDSNSGKQKREETENIESTFQVSVLAIQDPTDLTSLTASDIANATRLILQKASTCDILFSENVGIYRITDVQNPKFQDDRGVFEAQAFFSFVLTHKNISIIDVDYVSDFASGIHRY